MYEDNRRVRVTGPFTVESLPPHRLLKSDEQPESESAPRTAQASADFAMLIIDNLRRGGVQNTRRNERLKFDRLESFAGAWLNAAGEFTDKDG